MTQPWEYDEPNTTTGDRLTAEDAQNRRLIVVPIEYVPSIRTARGDEVDGIRVNVVDLESGTPFMGALWFGGRLIQAFKTKLGKLFVGYITKQPTAGGFKAWTFVSLTQDQQTLGMANQWLSGNPEFFETCMGDVRMAEQQAQMNATRQTERQGAPAWAQNNTQWQGQPQAQFGAPAQPAPPPPPWQQQQPQQSQPPGPPPVTPPLPPVQMPSNISEPTPLQPPGGSSVLERLRAQAAGQVSSPPTQTEQAF